MVFKKGKKFFLKEILLKTTTINKVNYFKTSQKGTFEEKFGNKGLGMGVFCQA